MRSFAACDRPGGDAGSSHGFLLGAVESWGVKKWVRDISHSAVSVVRTCSRSYVTRGSIADPITGEFDLVICIEVIEQMEETNTIAAGATAATALPERARLDAAAAVAAAQASRAAVLSCPTWLAPSSLRRVG